MALYARFYFIFSSFYIHGSETVRRFNFPRASDKSKLSAVLCNDLIRVKINAILQLYQRTVVVKCNHADSR